MKIKDTLQRDPASHPLVNQGQARISDSRNERTQSELRGELDTFVCEGQYADGVQKIIRSFLDNIGKTSQRGAWVSGFFGSGKSHLLKMLCHLWQDTSFPDGATARSLVPSIPEDLRALLRELDTAGRRAGGLIAAAGALPSGTTDNVRLTILGYPASRRRPSRAVPTGPLLSVAAFAGSIRQGESRRRSGRQDPSSVNSTISMSAVRSLAP